MAAAEIPLCTGHVSTKHAITTSKRKSRREFLKLAAASGAAAGFAPAVLAYKRETLKPRERTISANDRIGLATIGTGIIGFIDTDTALQVPGVEFVAIVTRGCTSGILTR